MKTIVSNNTKFYHGSDKEFSIGFTLTPQTDNYDKAWGGQEWDRLLEHFRPNKFMSRNKVVFMTKNIDDIDMAGGYDDYIYQVEPLGPYSMHDFNWISELEVYLSENLMIFEEAKNNITVKNICLNYWSAVPHYNESLWEFLTPMAKIVDIID